jgi:4-amino-4-deoxy-L-arabinose transferase-like glycosyltransferase
MDPETPSAQSRSRFFQVLPIGLILLLALGLRLWGLDHNPPGLFRDEARKAYSTYSLIETGRDLTGRVWPLQVKEFTAFTTPFYHWFSIPFIASMGVTLTSTRLLAALAGSLACLFVFLLGRDWVNRSTGLWAALILAVSPWHLLFSRWANQGILMTLFIPAALWLTWKTLGHDREEISVPANHADASHAEETPTSGVVNSFAWRWILPASFCWALAWNAYEPARLFVPLFLFALIGIEAYKGRSVIRLFFVGVLTVVWISPFVFDIVWKWNETQARLSAIAGDQPFNPAVFIGNYLLHWNPVYLFWSGDSNPRHHISGQGQLSWLECIAFLAGLFFLWKGNGLWRPWLVAWLLLAPVPAAFTHEGLPHALRTLMIVPAIALVAGYGVSQLVDRLPCPFHMVAPVPLVVLFLIQMGYTWTCFNGAYREETALYWEGGFVEAIKTVETNRKEGETCVISGLVEFPQSIVEFVTLPDPRLIQSGEALKGYRFVPTGQPLNPLEYKDARLFLIRPNEIRTPPWWQEIRPDEANEAMRVGWQLFRSAK